MRVMGFQDSLLNHIRESENLCIGLKHTRIECHYWFTKYNNPCLLRDCTHHTRALPQTCTTLVNLCSKIYVLKYACISCYLNIEHPIALHPQTPASVMQLFKPQYIMTRVLHFVSFTYVPYNGFISKEFYF